MQTGQRQNLNIMETFPVYLIFAVSGGTALIYQIIWARWLVLLFGNTTISVSIVLSIFMLGLALGSWIAGRFLHKANNPVRLYALAELGIGLFAVFFPLPSRLTDIIFGSLLSAESPLFYGLFIRAIFAFLLLLLPTTLMGTTLPLLTDFFHRSPRHSLSWKAGLLYSANTFGAAIGIIAAGFIFIELFGIYYTTLTAASMNFIVAFLGFWLSRGAPSLLPAEKPAERKITDKYIKLALWIIAASGATALASEVLWTRLIETLVGNSTYAFSMIVLLYLTGIATGSWIMSFLVKKLKMPVIWLVTLQALMGLFTFISIEMFEGLSSSMSQYKDAMLPLSVIFMNYFKGVIVLFPLALMSGACFPVATRIIDPESDDAKGSLIATAYAWNTMGAVIGSLFAGFLIAPFFDFVNAIYILGILYSSTALVASVLLISFSFKCFAKKPSLIFTGIGSLVIIFTGISMASRQDYFISNIHDKYPRIEVLYHKPGLQGITTVLKRGDEKTADVLLVNGNGMTVKTTDTKMMAHLPMLLHRNPEKTLVICFGMGTTYRSAISHGGRVTVIELVKEVFDAFNFFYEDADLIRSYPKGRMIVNDGRNFLKLTRDNFDIVTLDPPPPIDAAGVNHLHSREFIRLAKSRLNKGGIMAHWIPLPGSRAGVDNIETLEMLVSTFVLEFRYVYAIRSLHGVGLHLLGSDEPLDISMDRIKQRLTNKAVYYDLNEFETIPFSYFGDIKMLRMPESNIRIVTDDRPYLEFYLLRTLRTTGMKNQSYTYW